MAQPVFARRRILLVACHIFVLPFLAAPAITQAEPYCPERPGVTNSPCIMQKNALSIEVGVATYTKDQPDQYAFSQTLLRLGIIADVAEMRLGWAGVMDDTTGSGVGDVNLGTKIQVLRQDTAVFDLGATANVILDVGDKRFSASGNNPSLLLMASRNLSDQVAYTGNYQVTF